jgi:hypothetical protein
MSNPQVRATAAEAALEVSRSLSAEACADRMLELYQALLEGRTSRAGGTPDDRGPN